MERICDVVNVLPVGTDVVMYVGEVAYHGKVLGYANGVYRILSDDGDDIYVSRERVSMLGK